MCYRIAREGCFVLVCFLVGKGKECISKSAIVSGLRLMIFFF